MADYKELLRKAIAALPENNGASRRAVYEKARSALVGQLRAIQPPLAARDITTHRLQLEDGIRQVEQEASEATIAKLDHGDEISKSTAKSAASTNVSTPPAPSKGPSIEGIIASDRASNARPKITPRAEPTVSEPAPEPVKPEPVAKSEPKAPPPKPVVVAKNDTKEAPKDETKSDEKATTKNGRPLPSIVARAEAAKGRTGTTAFGVPSDKPALDGRNDNSRRTPSIEPRRDVAASSTRIEPAAMRGQAVARQAAVEPDFGPPAISAAMSTVREVEVEPALTADPQGAIDRAIATLDREARGDSTAADELDGADVDLKAEPNFEPAPKAKTKKSFPDPVRPKKQRETREPRERTERSPFVADNAGFQRQQAEGGDRGGISALTIFLFVFVILLAGVGGAGFWAWREGYIDLDALFASSEPTVVATDTVAADPATSPVAPADTAAVTGPGNTATSTDVAVVPDPAVPATNESLVVDDRLTASPDAAATPEVVEPLALAPANQPATEERLSADTAATAAPQTAEEAIAAVNPANIAGSQSLLLEAADDGTTSAIPFSGTVEWSKGTDEMGLPTLVGRANIPARNMGVELLIRKNSDPTLPASHLMEINFNVSETFIGGSVAGLPGVLLKNEELVQGSPLIGASARVVGNSFLFALSASPEDAATNNQLITGRKWMDIAIIYATGKRAIITLEKDQAATDLFNEVFTAWGATASASQ